MTRQERILQLPFFENKRELAEQVLKMEREEHVYLPINLKLSKCPRIHFEKKAIIGRIHEFYFVSVGNDGAWKYQLFKDEMKCREFLLHYQALQISKLRFGSTILSCLKALKSVFSLRWLGAVRREL